MVWKGVIIEESLKNRSILNLVKIIKSKKTTLENEGERGFLTFDYIELNDENKESFLKKASSSIKNKFYMHICNENVMIVIYENKLFEFLSNETEKLDQARKYGLSLGILKEQMPFEDLIKNPYA